MLRFSASRMAKKATARIFSLVFLCALLHAEPVDWLYTARYVVTMDAQKRIVENGAIAIRGERIIAVGNRADLEKQFQPKQRLDRPQALIMPGLINTHTHAPMSLLRGLADDLRLDVWLLGYMMPVERAFVRPDFVALGTTLACAEMIRSGTTCFADMYYFEEEVAEAAAAAGLRALCAQ